MRAWSSRRKTAASRYYRLAPASDGDDRRARGRSLRARSSRARPPTPAVRADDARLQEVLRLRKENFDAHAGPDSRDARQLVPGRSWAAWSRALGLLLPRVKVADLGCGEGYLTIEAARWASKVIAVDRSDGRADARQSARRGAAASRTSSGSAASSRSCRSQDAHVDVALLSQALHHAQRARRARSRRPRASRAGRPRAGARSARRTAKSGCARSSAIGGSASTTTS